MREKDTASLFAGIRAIQIYRKLKRDSRTHRLLAFQGQEHHNARNRPVDAPVGAGSSHQGAATINPSGEAQ